MHSAIARKRGTNSKVRFEITLQVSESCALLGTDTKSRLVQMPGVTPNDVHDAKVLDNLIREDNAAVYGAKVYESAQKKRAVEASGVLWAVTNDTKPGRDPTVRQRARNRRFGKARCRGIQKNGAQVFALLALANLLLARRTRAAA